MRGLGNVEPQKSYRAKNYFTYVTSITTLAAGASSSSSFNIDGDSDFFFTKLTTFALVADDGTTYEAQILPAVTVVIENTSSGRQYMNAPVPLGLLAGTALLPFILPMETFWPAKTTISVSYANISDNTTYSDLYLAFHGIKAFA